MLFNVQPCHSYSQNLYQILFNAYVCKIYTNINDAVGVGVLLVCMTLWHENASWIAGSFRGESIGYQILLTMNQKAELWFILCYAAG